jgi:hypothetical protein
VSGTNGIVVNAAPTDRVVLEGLDIEGLGSGSGFHGVNVLAGGKSTLSAARSVISASTASIWRAARTARTPSSMTRSSPSMPAVLTCRVLPMPRPSRKPPSSPIQASRCRLMPPTTSSASKLAYSTTAPTGNQLTERRHGCVGRTEQPRNGRWRILLDDSFQITTLTNDCPRDDWHSVAVYSGEANDVEKYLISSFPVRVREGKWEIVGKASCQQIRSHENRCIHRGIEGRALDAERAAGLEIGFGFNFELFEVKSSSCQLRLSSESRFPQGPRSAEGFIFLRGLAAIAARYAEDRVRGNWYVFGYDIAELPHVGNVT